MGHSIIWRVGKLGGANKADQEVLAKDAGVELGDDLEAK